VFSILAHFFFSLKQFAEAMPAWSLILMSAASPSAQAGTRRRSA
jgi:hypothetical protein